MDEEKREEQRWSLDATLVPMVGDGLGHRIRVELAARTLAVAWLAGIVVVAGTCTVAGKKRSELGIVAELVGPCAEFAELVVVCTRSRGDRRNRWMDVSCVEEPVRFVVGQRMGFAIVVGPDGKRQESEDERCNLGSLTMALGRGNRC